MTFNWAHICLPKCITTLLFLCSGIENPVVVLFVAAKFCLYYLIQEWLFHSNRCVCLSSSSCKFNYVRQLMGSVQFRFSIFENETQYTPE